MAAVAVAVASVSCQPVDGGAEISPDNPAHASATDRILKLRPQVLASYPHDPGAFTQGLLWHDNRLFESTGGFGTSTLRRVRLEDGVVEERRELPRSYFGEGLARVGDTLFQLTWRSGMGRRYELSTLELSGEFSYAGEGWGLCYDGRALVRSDGTNRLFFHRPEDFALERALRVTRNGRPQPRLNELECAEGWVYANVWMSDEIVRIDPADGTVVAVIDASGLLSAGEAGEADVLNGIAYRPERQTFLLTGKLWPRLFEVSFVESGV